MEKIKLEYIKTIGKDDDDYSVVPSIVRLERKVKLIIKYLEQKEMEGRDGNKKK